jgi:hypothetical protein
MFFNSANRSQQFSMLITAIRLKFEEKVKPTIGCG